MNNEDIEYLIDFITQTLNNNDEQDPFDLDEAEYLLVLRRKLKNMLPNQSNNVIGDSDELFSI